MGVVQVKSVASGTSVTFDNPTTAGNSIVVLARAYGVTDLGTTDITDNKSNTYTRRVAAGNGGVETKAAIYDCQAPTMGSSHTVSISAHTDQGITAIEVSGLTGSPSFDKSAAATNGSGAPSSSPTTGNTAALAQADEFIVATLATDQGNTDTITPSAGEGWTQAAESEAGNVELAYNSVYKTVAATTALAASWTLGGAHVNGQVIATYRSTAGGDATAPVSTLTSTSELPAFSLSVEPYVGEVGFVTNTTAGTTSTITTSGATIPVGDVLVIMGACDNTGSSGAATTIAVADDSAQSGSANVYTLQTPQAIADPGAASAGQQGFFVVCPVTRPLPSGTVITITFGNSTTAKAINCQRFRNIDTTTPVLPSSYARQDNQTGQSVSVAAGANPTAAGQVVLALVAVEGGTADAFTLDTDTTNGTWISFTRRGSGTTTSGSTLNSAYKLVTASGAQTFDHATMLGTARDHCAAILVLQRAGTAATAPVATVTSTTALPTITIQASQTAPVATLTSTTALPTITIQASQTAPVATLTSTTELPTIAVEIGIVVAVSTVTSTTELPAFTIVAGVSVTAPVATLTSTTSLPAFTISAGATAPVATLTSTTALPTVLISTGTNATAPVATLTATTRLPPMTTKPFAKSISGRRLLDSFGNDFIFRNWSSWGLAQNLSNADITTHLEGVAARDFNSVMVMMFGYHPGVDWVPYTAGNGSAVFTGTAFQSALGAGWGSMDRVVTEAHRLGLTVILSLYTAFGSTGPRADIEAASNAQMKAFGDAVAARYLDYDNICWHIGDDDTWGPSTSPIADRVDNFFQGINETEGSTRRPIRLVEPNNGTPGYTQFTAWYGSGNVNLTVNSEYDYTDDAVVNADAVHTLTGATTIPWWDCEPPYRWAGHYGDTSTIEPQEIRERIYSDIIRGGVGVNVGNEDSWPFGYSGLFSGGRTWQQTLTDPDAYWAQYAWIMFRDHVGNTAGYTRDSGAFITAGIGTGDTKAASAYSGDKGIVYTPTSRAMTADLSVFSGSWPLVKIRKYDPTDGTFTTIGTFSSSVTNQSISAPGNNASSTFSDWVFLFEGEPVTTAPVATLTSTTSLPAFTLSGSATTTPAVLTGTGSFPAPTIAIAATAVPAAVAGSGSQPTPVETTTSTAAPANVAGTGAGFTPGATTTSAAAAGVVTAPASLSGSAPVTAATTAPAVVAGAGSQPSPGTTQTSQVSPAVIAGAGSQFFGGLSVAFPAGFVAGVGSQPTPDVSTSDTNTAVPAVLNATGSGQTPTLVVTSVASPAVLTGVGTQPTPGGVTAVQLAPGVVVGGAVFTTPSGVTTALVAAGTLQTAGSQPSPATLVAVGPAPSGLTGVGSQPSPSLSTSVLANPPVVAGSGAAVTPILLVSSTAAAPFIPGVAVFPVPDVIVPTDIVVLAATLVGFGTQPTPVVLARSSRAYVWDPGSLQWRSCPAKRWDGAAWVADLRPKAYDPVTVQWFPLNQV